MIYDISIIIPPAKEKDQKALNSAIESELAKKGCKENIKDAKTVLIKKSIDARHGRQKLVMRYKVYTGEDKAQVSAVSSLPVWKKAGDKTVAIIGAGPAGLFGALKLLESGIRPVIIERGSEAPKRKRDIAAISTKGRVDGDSNYCFGEGGAGTFSDGKLYTRSNKRGDISRILRIFANFGAKESICTDAHPHIGTDCLPAIIMSMRKKIEELGGVFHFDTRFTGFEGTKDGDKLNISAVKVRSVADGSESTIPCDAVLLATGHSATDVYEILAKTAPESLEAKTFAMGVRAEHPRTLIDSIQYHGEDNEDLGAAEYRLTSQQNERGVYSFCMCPGGFVVPSATEDGQIVVNGMSAAGRNSRWSNAALVVETRPEDIPQKYIEEAKKKGSESLAGLLYRTEIERLTAEHGDGQKAPAQRITDFLASKESEDLPPSSYAPGLVPSNIRKWLPPSIAERLALALNDFDRAMKGFITNDAILIATETRTSTPVRIVRDKESGKSPAFTNLYPAGEGSGYSGGIVSSAMDGENECALIARSL